MTIYNINIDELRTLLKFDGVDLKDYDNEGLEYIIKAKINELEGFTGINIHPEDYTSTSKNWVGTLYELPHYPLLNIHQIYLNDRKVCKDYYNVNYDLGIIYFDEDKLGNPPHYYPRRFGRGYGKSKGNVIKIQYTSGLDDFKFKSQIFPLIKDMISYTVKYNTVNQRLGGMAGFVNNLHEGDLSMSMGAMTGATGGAVDYGYSPSVNSRIDDLKRKYSYNSRVNWL